MRVTLLPMPADPRLAKSAGRPRTSGALGAAEACREVITAYFHLSDADALDELGDLFSADMELGHGATGVRGRDTAVEFLRSRRGAHQGRKTLHILGSIQMLELAETTASSFAAFSFYDSKGTGHEPGGMRLVGYYESHDSYVFDGDRWKLASHHAEPVGNAP
jgi:hypothetical protein